MRALQSRRSIIVIGSLSLVALLAPGTAAGKPSTSSCPSPRTGPGLAYDASRQEIVLFGGRDDRGGVALDDTWTWDGTAWTEQVSAQSPSPRYQVGMAYDHSRGNTVLFGGVGERIFGDTWTWDGKTWRLQETPLAPVRRNNPGFAYDLRRREVVMFAGTGPAGQDLNDTWTWNGTMWTRENPPTHPPHRDVTTMAFDIARREVVLFGGNGEGEGYLDDTWTWNGTTWTQEYAETPLRARAGNGLAYDKARQEVVLFGGVGSSDPPSLPRALNDTWTWDGTTWMEEHPETHAARIGLGMAYFAATRQVVLFGDDGGNGDTWAWDGTTWTQLASCG